MRPDPVLHGPDLVAGSEVGSGRSIQASRTGVPGGQDRTVEGGPVAEHGHPVDLPDSADQALTDDNREPLPAAFSVFIRHTPRPASHASASAIRGKYPTVLRLRGVVVRRLVAPQLQPDRDAVSRLLRAGATLPGQNMRIGRNRTVHRVTFPLDDHEVEIPAPQYHVGSPPADRGGRSTHRPRGRSAAGRA